MYKSGFRWLLAMVFVLNALWALSVSPVSAAGLQGASVMRQMATGDGSPSDSNIKYIGRWDTSDLSNVKSYWSGAYFRVNFTGTTLSIKLGATVPIYVTIDGVTKYYSNANGTVNLTSTPLASGTHTLRVAARSEYDTIQFKGLVLSSGASTQAPAAKSKLIEFVGDSITAGCCTLSNYVLNNYAWLTGEALNADHTQIAFSGICLQDAVSCYSENRIGMSVQFFKLQTVHYLNSPAWDFNRYQPNQVVINLGTNDSTVGVSDSTFQSTYTTFLQNVRAKYPNAEIYVLRTFGGYKVASTQAAVNARISAGDSKVRYVDTTGWVTTGDFDSDNLHPNTNGHIKIANRLTSVLGGAPVTPTPTPPPSGTNFLTNADMESGTTNWVVNGVGTLSSDTSQHHGGTRSVKITGRTSAWNGIGQNVAVSNFPASGQNVTVSVWVRSQTGTPTAKATLRLTASTTTYVTLASATINASGWTQLTATVPVSWSGTLTGVLFYVETAAGTDNIYIDDANLHR